MKIRILTCFNENTLSLLKSLKLSKKNCSDYRITILGNYSDLSKLKENIDNLRNNDFIIDLISTEIKSSLLYTALNYIENSDIEENLFYCESVLIKRDLSALASSSKFGNMMAFAQCEENKNSLKDSYQFNSKFVYINTKRFKSEELLGDLDTIPAYSTKLLNTLFSGKILSFKVPVLPGDIELKSCLSLNKFKNYSQNEFDELTVAETDLTGIVSKCVENFYGITQALYLDKNNIENLQPRYNNTLVFNFDKNNSTQFTAACASFLNVTEEKCNIICLVKEDVDLATRYKILFDLSQYFKDKFVIHFINVDEQLKEVFSTKLFEVRGISSVAYARLFIPFLLKNFKYVAYSDCDVIFKKDPFKYLNTMTLYQNDMIYGVPSIRLNKRNNSSLYINSGFLYFDLSSNESRSRDLYKQIISELKNNYIFQDQDIINKIYEGKKGKLPPEFCMIPKCYVDGVYNSSVARSIFTPKELSNVKDPIIVHWAGIEKPWNSSIPKGSEWISVNSCIENNKPISIDEEEIVVKQSFIRSLTMKATRSSIAKVIGEDNIVPKIASYPMGIIVTSKLPDSFIIRSEDYSLSYCCTNKSSVDEDDLNLAIKNLCRNRKPLFTEAIINGTPVIVTKNKDNIRITNNFEMLSDDQKSLIVNLANKIYSSFEIYKSLEFIVDKKGKVLFRSIS